MKSALIKDILREIGRSKSRFFSIFAIIALGAGFFAGLKITCPDMLETQERYFHEQNLMDIRLVSSYGFSENDVEAIGEYDDIKDVYPTWSKDVFIRHEGSASFIAKMMALPDEGVNTPILLEGRLPENPDECVVEQHSQLTAVFEIGDTVTAYTSDRNDPLEDSLERKSWEVVGVVMSPQYIGYDRGMTTIGDGKVDTFIMIPKENFTYDVYTEIYLTSSSAAKVSTFSDEYTEIIENTADELEIIAEEREAARLEEIKADAYEEIDEGKKEIEDAEKKLADAEKELADALAELEQAEKDLASGQREYEDGKKKLEEGREDFEREIADAEYKLIIGKEEIDNGWAEYEEGKAQLEEGRAQLEQTFAALGISPEGIYDYIARLEEKIAFFENIPGMDAVVAGLELQLQIAQSIISPYEQILAGEAELNSARAALEEGEAQIYSGWVQLEEGRKTGEEELAKAENELIAGKAELEKGRKKLDDGWDEYNEGLLEFQSEKSKAEREISKAKRDISKAEKDLAELEEPVWYIFTRADDPGFGTYESDVYIIESVGKVFPVFFMLVAMLVCLTTMTRMVEEHRTEIGTMKALGYGKGTVVMKYTVYSALASFSGAVFGIAFCSFVFPEIIYGAYGMMYIIPDLVHVPLPGTWITATVISVLCTVLAAIMSCEAELRECPAELMRPKAPKAGKRVLLEKIPFIWKRLNFNRKVTVRNLFRYKKRIFMTILGIAGCAALTLTGLGIYSSISVILEKQYNEIFNYDLIVSLDSDSSPKETRAVVRELSGNENCSENLEAFLMAADYENIADTSLAVASDADLLEEMIILRDRKSGETFELSDEGVIITERFSELAGLSAGDEFIFTCDGKEFTAKITAIAENYTMHFIYMTETLFEKLTGEKPEYNTVFTVLAENSAAAREKLANSLTEMEGVLALTFSYDTMETFSDTVENLNYVVVLIIVCAAALAFVVLYNLTNINITERIREIATIKVLGFYDREVSAYVFRENFILTLMGTGVGLGLGVWLHSFVLGIIQSENIMFGRGLPPWTFIAAFAMTIFFGLMVNWLMFFRLRKISMVESLKSVE